MGPPLALCTYPNEYNIVNTKGEELGKIIEEDNCFCQKCCFPSMRPYESTIFSSPQGAMFKTKRAFAYS